MNFLISTTSLVTLLYLTGTLIILASFMGIAFYPVYGWSVLFYSVTGIVAGLIIIAFGKIITLLDEIANKK